MESEIHYKRVGIFIVVGIVLVSVILAWLSHSFTGSTKKDYAIFFEQQTLDGLQRDSAVTMKGIKIGTVQDYDISHTNIQKVKVIISLDPEVPVKTDTRAVLKRNFLTGIAKIDLVGSTQESAEISKKKNEDLPIIPEELTQFEKIADSVPSVLGKVENSLERIALVMSNKNIENFDKTLDSISTIAQELTKLSPKIEKTLSNFENVSSTASDFSDKYLKEESDKNLPKKLELILSNIEEISKNLKEASVDAPPLTRSVSRSMVSIQESLKNIAQDFQTLSDSYGNPNLLLNQNQILEKNEDL